MGIVVAISYVSMGTIFGMLVAISFLLGDRFGYVGGHLLCYDGDHFGYCGSHLLCY